LLVLGALTLVRSIAVYLPPGAWLGFPDPQKWSEFQRYFWILSPMVVFLCLSGLQAGVLNTYGRFGLPSLLPALHNLIWIGAIALAVSLPSLAGDTPSQICVMCGGILLGTIVQWFWQMRALRKAGLKLRFQPFGRDEGVSRVFRAMGPTILALAVFQLNTLLDLLLAEWLVDGHGAVSAYSYASRLFQCPLGIVGIALGTAIFPMLSRYAARGEAVKVTGGLLTGVRLLAFIVLPAAAGLIALNHEIVAATYRNGEFDWESAERTARVLIFFSMALPIVATLQLVTKAFYALKDTRTPTRVALASVAVNLCANIILVQTPLQEAGLALGTTISSAFNLITLSILLSKRLSGTIVESRRLRVAEAASDH
ncbi:MAG: polysaccharide biosynthesis C-terminal domain-containing protein, partial [Planctomycetes bacterium]|nr:polysaccharide biosynthesis C-terminal domain-containing protein [Planctomycetota bacterium]